MPKERPFEAGSGHEECSHRNTAHGRLDCLINRGLLPPRDEMKDAMEKSRKARKDHHLAKLTKDQADEIRRRYSAGDVSQVQLAREYRVTNTVIGGVVRGETYLS